MKKIILTAVVLIIAALFISGVSAAPALGGDKGTIVVKSNAEGAKVDLLSIGTDLLYTGTIQNGQAVFEVYSTATPINKAVVYCDGYKPSYCVVNGNPAKGDTKTYTVNLEKIQEAEDNGYVLVVKNRPEMKAELYGAMNQSLQILEGGELDENGVIIFAVCPTKLPAIYLKLYTTENPPSVMIDLPDSGETLVHYMADSCDPQLVDTPKHGPNPTEKPTEPTSSPLGVAAGIFGILGAVLLLRRE